MCRSGHESTSTDARRCPCVSDPALRERYDAGRLMSRHGRRYATATTAKDKDRARGRFTAALDRYRTATGMGDEQYPRIPAAISAVSAWTPQRLDATPASTLEDEAVTAAERGDYWTAEVLCAEADRRETLAASSPAEYEDAEQQRWTASNVVRTASWRGDPVTDPASLTGRRGEAYWRDLHDEYTERFYLDADSATNGNVLNHAGRTKGVPARTLFRNPVLFKNYASEDLKRWMLDGHPHLTYKAFRGDPQAMEAVRKRDLGI